MAQLYEKCFEKIRYFKVKTLDGEKCKCLMSTYNKKKTENRS